MDENEQSIAITLRSFVLPPDAGDDFPLGKPLPLRIEPGTSVGKLLERIFTRKVDQIGMVVINGKIAEEKVILADGDRVDVYELLGGG
jgi:sulfur carrier protein ThiS